MDPWFIVLAYLGIIQCVFGAQRINIKERLQRSLNSAAARRQRRSIETTPENLMGLERGENLEAQEVMVTSHDTVKVKYTETYKGLPIIGEAVVLERTGDGGYTEDYSGSLLEGIAEDVPSITPVLSVQDVYPIAVRETGRKSKHIMFKSDRNVKLAIYVIHEDGELNNQETKEVKAVLVYQVTITDADPYWPIELRVIIDGNTGEVLHKSNLIESYGFRRRKVIQEMAEVEAQGGNEKIGGYVFGKDKESLKVQKVDEVMCKVQNDHVAVVHLNFTEELDNLDKEKSQGYMFVCSQGIRDSINGGYSPISDSYYFFNKVYEMYNVWYNTKPLKHRAIMAVHYGNGLENAFYMPDHNIMVMGDGKDRFYPLVAIGVIAHETSHGYTSEHSNLEYAEQSGGINEAFSDMTSETAEAYANSASDWMIGYKITKNPDDVYRWLSEPQKDNGSVASLQDFCPGMDVHYSSGIFNKAFYLLSHRPGWDTRKAFHVFLTANTLYWRKNTDFADGACGALKAAKDLGFPVKDVESVFRDVDVEPCVKKRYNFQNIINTYVSKKSTFNKYFELRGITTDKVSIEVLLAENKTGQFDLEVSFNGKNVATLKSNESGSIALTDLQPGRYHITIKGDLPLFSVYVIIDHIFHGEITTTISHQYGRHGNNSFNLDSNDLHPDLGLVIRSKGTHKGHYLFTNYGKPIDMYSMMYDSQGRKLDDFTRESLYCTLRGGYYDVVMLTAKEDDDDEDTQDVEAVTEEDFYTIDAYRVFNLYPRTDF